MDLRTTRHEETAWPGTGSKSLKVSRPVVFVLAAGLCCQDDGPGSYVGRGCPDLLGEREYG